MFTLIIEDKHGAIVDEYSFEDGEFIIGRSQQADIVLPADNVSRRHARLFTVDGRCYIEDLKAANGIWLNGKRIYNVTELPRSAQVRIGDFFLHIEGAAYARPMGSAIYGRLIPMPGSIGELTELSQPTVLIGRGKDCAVVLSDVSVSRIHSKITQDQSGRVIVEDLRSSNGTYVNDRRIDQQELQHADRIRFGTVAFAYQVEGMPEVDVQEQAYAPPPQPRQMQPARVQPQQQYGSQYNAYVPVERPLSVADHRSQYDDGHGAPPRSILPQVAAVAVILVAVVGLIILVLFAYDRWLGPALRPGGEEAKVAVAAKPAATGAGAAAVPVAAPAADSAAAVKAQVDELVAKGQDAVARRQWDEAEQVFRNARRLDPINSRPTEALNMIAMEKKAGARFAQAESAFAQKDYATAIRQHRLIPPNSVYRADADAALDAIASILEMAGDQACGAKDWSRCQESYNLARSTGFAAASVEQKYAKAMAKKPN
jgi:pSer/pThr/pTyr-binding forkhead associated (FHA) protein